MPFNLALKPVLVGLLALVLAPMLAVFSSVLAEKPVVRDDSNLGARWKLVVFESSRCVTCRDFRDIYAKDYFESSYNISAPMEFVEAGSREAASYTLQSPVEKTPTFVLVGPSGREVDRLTGFPKHRVLFYKFLDKVL